MTNNAKRRIIMSVLLFLIIVLQTTLMPRLTLFGGVLELPLLFIAVTAILVGRDSAMLWGLLAGLLLDLLAGKYIGLNILALAAVGLFCGMVFGRMHKGNIFISFGTVGAGFIAYCLIYIIIGRFAGIEMDIMHYLLGSIFPSLVYTAIVSLPVYIISYTIYRKNHREI